MDSLKKDDTMNRIMKNTKIIKGKRTEAYKGHCVLCKDVLSFVSQTFDF